MSAADISRLNRRQFIGTGAAATAAVSGGFVFGFPTAAAAQGVAPEVNAWVVVQPDDKVVIRIARSEMGQGTLTGLAQMVAEELECDWAKVSTEYPTPGQSLARKRPWGDFGTGGSRGIRTSHEYVRKGGASARLMLVQAAADGWKVPAAECTVDKGVITHTASGRKTSYGKVALAAAKLTPPAAADVPLKDPKDWKLLGKRMARLDTADKTNGKKIFGADLKLPGMLTASINACPVFGGKLKSFDAAAVEKMPGVKKVLAVGDNAVAVVADTWWHAHKALGALPVEWDFGAHAKAQQADFNAVLKAGLDAPDAVVGNSNGDIKAALAGAARKIEAVYAFPHQNHATMEPMNATAKWTPERCEVWTPTQNGEASLAATALAAGLPAAQCEVYKIDLGGGFGRRGAVQDWITQAKMTAALDAEGNITGLHMRISGQSILAGVAPQNIRDGKDPVVFQGLNNGGGEAMIGYSFPALLVDHAMRNPHVPPGFWRGVNLNQNAVYMECFIDEVAFATGQDPLALRRKLMANHPKHLAVLNAAAERAGWGTPAPDVNGQKVHRGLCVTHGFGSYVAACAEVSVSGEGKLKIHRIVAATDCGYAVNPQQIEAQVEGSFVYGLSSMLYEECTVKDGRIEQRNFDTYPSMRIAEMPKVETIVMPSGGFWGGVGEPTIAVAAPAVLNAIFAATGKRIRELPIKQQSLRA